MQTRRSMLQALFATGATLLIGQPLSGATPRKQEIKVFKRHYSPCCDSWMTHLAKNGFAVRPAGVSDLEAVKADYAIPKSLVACHTAIIDGYIVEGHVPAEQIHRLLAERPWVRGIAVAGKPAGAPGHDKDGQKEPYTVVLFDGAGKITPFAQF